MCTETDLSEHFRNACLEYKQARNDFITLCCIKEANFVLVSISTFRWVDPSPKTGDDR